MKPTRLKHLQLNVLKAWWSGRYALGWRGALAEWLIEPALNKAIANDLDIFYTPPTINE